MSLEDNERLLKEAGYSEFGTGDSFSMWKLDKTCLATVYRSGIIRFEFNEKELPRYLTAPALVQTLVDALKYALDDLLSPGYLTREKELALADKFAELIAAAERANLPRLYSMEEIRQRMDEVFGELHGNSRYSYTEVEASERAFHLLAERLEKRG